MSQRAYDNDPRVQAELKREEEEKAAAKQAKKEANAAKWAKINEQKEAEERVDNGEEIEVVVKDFPDHEEMLFQDLKGKYEG